MQTAAEINLVLIDLSSNTRSVDSQSAIRDDRSYLHILLSEFAQAFHSRQAFQTLADKLISLAEHAYCLRDMKTVQEAALILMNSPIDSARQVGHYYQALTVKRNGKKDEARALLGTVAEDAPLMYRARAIQTLGTIHHEHGELDDALRLYLESARAAKHKKSPNLLANLIAHSQISFIKSDIGSHREALGHLETLLPLVQLVAKQYPFYFYAYHNALAVEFGELGRIDEAEAALSIALASPFAAAYPEWTETRDEIAAKRTNATSSVVAINRSPDADPSSQAEPQQTPQRSRLRRSTWLADENTLLQRASIKAAAIATIADDQLTHTILDRLLICTGPRAPPALS